MLVSHGHEFICLKARKAADTLLATALQPLCMPNPVVPLAERVRTSFGVRRTIGPRPIPAQGRLSQPPARRTPPRPGDTSGLHPARPHAEFFDPETTDQLTVRMAWAFDRLGYDRQPSAGQYRRSVSP